MVFSSLVFLCVFLPVMIIGYYILPSFKAKNVFLLLGSLFFYAWGEPKYVLVMILSIVGNYLFGLLVHFAGIRDRRGQNGGLPAHRLSLAAAVVFNLGILFVFKYFTFFLNSINDLFRAHLNIMEIALPIGISFYTFQGMSYVIDVYREDGKVSEDGAVTEMVQKNFVNLALYISMFPQLIAGPIVRYSDIKDSLKKRFLSADRFAAGAERFIIGLAKKAILANVIGETATNIMTGDFSMMGTATAWLGAVCYTLQIYFDFSGYSDMAIGLGRILGFEFMENFNYPYISRSITEFWRRWHISLSSWFRDYLYIPLGGNRRGNVYVNLFIVFVATGLWHGAAWGFLLWGLWHGAFMILERVFRNKQWKFHVPAPIHWLYTMLIVVFGWVLFSVVDWKDTLEYVKVMLHLSNPEFIRFSVWYYLDAKLLFLLAVAVLASLPLKNLLESRWKGFGDFLDRPAVAAVRRVLLLLLLAVCVIFIINSTYNPFIYFRF